MKRRVLFVDDEARVLEGLENMLRSYRKQWDMTFVLGGAPAKAAIETSSFDVVVSDMRMPGIDGAKLLSWVRDKFPAIVRIILSGYAEVEASNRAVPVAHQFLLKPCEPKLLADVIERVCALRLQIDDEAVRRVIGKLDRLPPAPKVYTALTAAIADPKVDGRAIAAILRRDMGLCAKLLQLVNSSFFRVSRTITSIEQAVGFLGIDTVRNLVMVAEVFDGSRSPADTALIESLQQRGIATGDLARRIASGEQAEDAYVAGLLHDVGELVLATSDRAAYAAVTAEAKARNLPRVVVESERDGVTHAEVGAYLLGLWGLPHVVVEAVANHHAPWRAPHDTFGALDAVFVADYLLGEGEGAVHVPPDATYAATLSIDRRLDEWRNKTMSQGAAP
jgi:HD-like signal output (HDOD) protein